MPWLTSDGDSSQLHRVLELLACDTLEASELAKPLVRRAPEVLAEQRTVDVPLAGFDDGGRTGYRLQCCAPLPGHDVSLRECKAVERVPRQRRDELIAET